MPGKNKGKCILPNVYIEDCKFMRYAGSGFFLNREDCFATNLKPKRVVVVESTTITERLFELVRLWANRVSLSQLLIATSIN